jgi:hypothetical protein
MIPASALNRHSWARFSALSSQWAMSKRGECEGGYGDQLEESAAGVLCVGQARCGSYAHRAVSKATLPPTMPPQIKMTSNTPRPSSSSVHSQCPPIKAPHFRLLRERRSR